MDYTSWGFESEAAGCINRGAALTRFCKKMYGRHHWDKRNWIGFNNKVTDYLRVDHKAGLHCTNPNAWNVIIINVEDGVGPRGDPCTCEKDRMCLSQDPVWMWMWLELFFTHQGSTLEKKPWGQLAPKFLDLVASANFFGCQKISAGQTVHTAFSSARRKSKDAKPYEKKALNVALL